MLASSIRTLSSPACTPLTLAPVPSPLQDMKQSFQNLTVLYMADMVEANQQASFTYKFMPSPRFEPADFGFVLDVSFVGESCIPQSF